MKRKVPWAGSLAWKPLVPLVADMAVDVGE